ncbi:MAG TPA: right-handed parallel beta-helix repeat-containing protein [Polyangiaceae bacterium]|jgi:hypothetical protein|nr:right-handed parallel beta-helix repeat-containing protein [Polyangiaceae bacterium]
MRSLFALATALCVGCGGADDVESAGSGGSPGECPPGARWVNDRCLDAGVQDNGCPAGEVASADGACAPAGVPPEACAPGFEPDEDGCAPILPAMPCEDGRMATPGETRCREVAPCRTGTWGAIPTEPNTQYVDGSYTGNDSDGTSAKPWTTIQQAVFAAQSGAIVAVAEGSYAESLDIQKPIRLWGRCPDLVEIVTPVDGVYFGAGADGAEVRDLAIRGDRYGITAIGADDIRIDRVWVHDTAELGIYSEGVLSVTRSLVEATSFLAVHVAGGSLTVEDTVVRETQPGADGSFGRGINVQMESGSRSSATVRRSVVTNNRTDGMFFRGIGATIEATVVSDTQSQASDGNFGGGIGAGVGPTGERGNLTIDACVLSHNRYGGIEVVGSDVAIHATTVRDTLPREADGEFGAGLSFYDSPAGERPNVSVSSCAISGSHGNGVWLDTSDGVITGTVVRDTSPAVALPGRGINATEHGAGASVLTLSSSVVSNSIEAGVVVAGSIASLDGVLLRDTQPNATTQRGGVGILVQDFTGGPGEATIAKSVLQNNHDMGIFVASADVIIDATMIRQQLVSPLDGTGGVGVQVQPAEAGNHRPQVTLRDSIVEDNHGIGFVEFASDARIEHSLIRHTQVDGLAGFGDGVAAITFIDPASPATLTISNSRIEANVRAGVANFGAVVSLEKVDVACNPIALAAEPRLGVTPTFHDLGGTICGCGEDDGTCKAVSAGLAPPEAVMP